MNGESRGVEPESLNVALIGAGTMGEVILRAMVEKGLLPREQVVASDVDRTRLREIREKYGVGTEQENPKAVDGADLVILAVKPQVMDGVLSDIGGSVREGQSVFSVAAGVTTARIENGLGAKVPVVRIMPNTPCLVGAGVCAVAGGSRTGRKEMELAFRIFSPLGEVVEVEEELMDAVTGLSGSGPAYIYLLIEALSDGGVMAGLDRGTSLRLAAQTVKGAAEMVLETGLHPGELKDMVTSPAGTTITGVRVLEERGLRSAALEAVVEATRRSRELGDG